MGVLFAACRATSLTNCSLRTSVFDGALHMRTGVDPLHRWRRMPTASPLFDFVWRNHRAIPFARVRRHQLTNHLQGATSLAHKGTLARLLARYAEWKREHGDHGGKAGAIGHPDCVSREWRESGGVCAAAGIDSDLLPPTIGLEGRDSLEWFAGTIARACAWW